MKIKLKEMFENKIFNLNPTENNQITDQIIGKKTLNSDPH
jgi:hypothetical protein